MVANRLLMVRPAAFQYNEQTAASNVFQQRVEFKNTHQKALQEFDEAVKKIRRHNIAVDIIEDTPNPAKPDAVFPNNWFSVHDDCVITYPMAAENRRSERRLDVIEYVSKRRKIIDLSAAEVKGLHLEGTGSLVLDRKKKVAFAALSSRTDERLARHWCEVMQYTPCIFRTVETNPVYHTNVIMAIGNTMAVCCFDVIDPTNRGTVKAMLSSYQSLAITKNQMDRFAANILLVEGLDRKKYWILSTTAFEAFAPEQLQLLENDGAFIKLNIPTIETCGGGSARCMIAEIGWEEI